MASSSASRRWRASGPGTWGARPSRARATWLTPTPRRAARRQRPCLRCATPPATLRPTSEQPHPTSRTNPPAPRARDFAPLFLKGPGKFPGPFPLYTDQLKHRLYPTGVDRSSAIASGNAVTASMGWWPRWLRVFRGPDAHRVSQELCSALNAPPLSRPSACAGAHRGGARAGAIAGGQVRGVPRGCAPRRRHQEHQGRQCARNNTTSSPGEKAHGQDLYREELPHSTDSLV